MLYDEIGFGDVIGVLLLWGGFDFDVGIVCYIFVVGGIGVIFLFFMVWYLEGKGLQDFMLYLIVCDEVLFVFYFGVLIEWGWVVVYCIVMIGWFDFVVLIGELWLEMMIVCCGL